MNNNEVKNVENKQNNSLMRKTKAQLVEIILRKDNIEKNLRTDIKNIEDNLKKYEANLHKCEVEISSMTDDYHELKNEYRYLCDEKASVECELKNTINKQIKIIRLLAIIFIISVIANILLYL